MLVLASSIGPSTPLVTVTIEMPEKKENKLGNDSSQIVLIRFGPKKNDHVNQATTSQKKQRRK